MNWKKILKDKSKQPSTGTYSDWKEQIAEECYFQCIYCSINEAQFGGIDHFHIEHYKPKSIERFKKYENDIMNLFYACPICNRFKSNDWPNDEDDLDKACYPNPSEYDYTDLFELDIDTYKLEGKYKSTKYMTERLFLNRTQLIYERRETVLIERKRKVMADINHLKKLEPINGDIHLITKMLDIVTQMNETLSKRVNIRPYKLAEIRK